MSIHANVAYSTTLLHTVSRTATTRILHIVVCVAYQHILITIPYLCIVYTTIAYYVPLPASAHTTNRCLVAYATPHTE